MNFLMVRHNISLLFAQIWQSWNEESVLSFLWIFLEIVASHEMIIRDNAIEVASHQMIIRENAIDLLGKLCCAREFKKKCINCIKCCRIQIKTSKPLPMHKVYLLYN